MIVLPNSLQLSELRMNNDLKAQIQGLQKRDISFLREQIGHEGFSHASDKTIMFQGRICIPGVEEIRMKVLEEWHKRLYHSLRIYKNVSRSKEDLLIAKNERRYNRVCVRVWVKKFMIEHHKPFGLLQPLSIPEVIYFMWAHYCIINLAVQQATDSGNITNFGKIYVIYMTNMVVIIWADVNKLDHCRPYVWIRLYEIN